MNRKECLEAALDAVDRRPKTYGKPEQNFDRIAALWNVYLAEWVELNATDVATMMALMKVARLMATPNHTDSWVDLAGYAACGAEVGTAQLEEVSTAEATVLDVAADWIRGLDTSSWADDTSYIYGDCDCDLCRAERSL